MADEISTKLPELTILAELSDRMRREKEERGMEEKHSVSTMPEIGTTKKLK